MDEIRCKRWTANNRVSRPHLFLGESEVSLCGSPRTSGAEREWETLINTNPGDICWACQDRRKKYERSPG